MPERDILPGLRRPGDCFGCGADYPHCDCAHLEDNEGRTEAREAQETAWEIIDAS